LRVLLSTMLLTRSTSKGAFPISSASSTTAVRARRPRPCEPEQPRSSYRTFTTNTTSQTASLQLGVGVAHAQTRATADSLVAALKLARDGAAVAAEYVTK
jgi:hypothetical protein